MSTNNSCTKEDIQSHVASTLAMKKKTPEIKTELQLVLNESVPFERIVQRWFDHFKDFPSLWKMDLVPADYIDGKQGKAY